jgi:hypothetical protein
MNDDEMFILRLGRAKITQMRKVKQISHANEVARQGLNGSRESRE